VTVSLNLFAMIRPSGLVAARNVMEKLYTWRLPAAVGIGRDYHIVAREIYRYVLGTPNQDRLENPYERWLEISDMLFGSDMFVIGYAVPQDRLIQYVDELTEVKCAFRASLAPIWEQVGIQDRTDGAKYLYSQYLHTPDFERVDSEINVLTTVGQLRFVPATGRVEADLGVLASQLRLGIYA
jgi:hypothetical protein